MNVNKKELKYKELLSLQTELNTLYKLKHSIKPIKLDKPIQHGYVRYLKLNETKPNDWSNIKWINKHKSVALKAFELCGQVKMYHKDKSFIVRKGKFSYEKHPYMKIIRDPRFQHWHSDEKRIKLENEIKECKNFLKHIIDEYSCNCNSDQRQLSFIPHYEFNQEWKLEEITEIHWLTHFTPVDPNIEERIAEINNKMYREHGFEKLQKKNYGREWREKTRYSTLKFKDYEAEGDLDF